jgi:hypothetical protein
MTRTRALAALAATATTLGAAAALPGSAGAAVTASFADSTLTVAGDGANDNAVLAATPGGNYALNGTDTGTPVDAAVKLVVNPAGGNDLVDVSALAAAQYDTLVINGGDGDDLLIGGRDGDVLNGDGGNDRLVAGPNPGGTVDAMNGGDGNDTMVWNNGDGSDVDEGGNGADTSEVNGSATGNDVFTINPGAAAGRVQFDRTSLNGATAGSFSIDAVTERFEVNGLGGDDAITGAPGLAARLSNGMRLNGGPGADTVTGGDTADLVEGGDANDTLDGGAGDDRVEGQRGNDVQRGGDGADTLVWNNGDGSDVDDGSAGLDTTEVNGAGAGDTFVVTPNGTRTKFERTNLGPFTLDIDTEALSVNGLGGDDTLTVVPGLAGRLAIVAGGGNGNDTLTGGDEPDAFSGGDGNDRIDGGRGFDVVDGDAGDDALFARDGSGDLVRGGAGTDTAQTDAPGTDVVDGVESVDALAAPRAAAPRAGKARLVRTGRRVSARFTVTSGAGGATALTVTTRRPVKLGKVRLVALLGSRTIRLQPGQTRTVSVLLAKGSRKLVKKGGLAVRAAAVA